MAAAFASLARATGRVLVTTEAKAKFQELPEVRTRLLSRGE
jgi:RNA-splicing ligase RtcB